MWWLILCVNLAGPWCPDISSNIIWDVSLRVFIRMSCCSVAQSRLSLCDPMDCSTPGFPVLHHLPELAQTHVHWVGDAIQPFCPLSSPSPPALNLAQHQGLFKWVGSLHQVAKVLELQHQSFQWISLVAQSCLTLCDPMDCSMPGLPVHHQLPEFTQIHVHWVSDAIQLSHPVVTFSSCLQSFPASGSFPMS